MSENKHIRATLRNHLGEHMSTLTEDEVAYYEVMATEGRVIKSRQIRKGRVRLIFRLKMPPTVEASNAKPNACSLTKSDMEGFAGLAFPESNATRKQLERWRGYGL